MVPGGGFEPPTRGFSIPCSTPELPGQRDHRLEVRIGLIKYVRAAVKALLLRMGFIRRFLHLRAVHRGTACDVSE